MNDSCCGYYKRRKTSKTPRGVPYVRAARDIRLRGGSFDALKYRDCITTQSTIKNTHSKERRA